MTTRPSRRAVLGSAGAAAFTTNLFTGRLRGASDRIALGFIGTGGRGGDGLIVDFLQHADCQCAAVCDAFTDRREKRAAQIDAAYAKQARGGYRGAAMHADFRELLQRSDIDAVVIATRESPIDCAIRTDLISHLSDIAVRTGRRIRWDPVTETISGDAEAARMMNRDLRKPWSLQGLSR